MLGLISTRTGLASTKSIELTVEQNVIGVVMTSSPYLIPREISDKCNAAVHEFKDKVYLLFL